MNEVHRSSVLLTPPVVTPVSITDVKLQVRYSASDYDTMFTRYLAAAIEYCQEYQWAQYCTATYVDTFERFWQPLQLTRSPVQSITSVQYVDTAGVTQTLTPVTDYKVDLSSKPCRLVPAYAKWWPATRCHISDVTVTYVAGYGDATAVPDDIKYAILLKAALQYESCDQAAMDATIHALLDKKSFRLFF